MNLYVKRLFLLALSSIRSDDSDVPTIRLTAQKFAEIFQLSGKSVYSRIQAAAKDIMGMVVHVKDPTSRDWEMFHYVDHARYVSNNGAEAAYIELTVSEKLRPYLLELRREFSHMEAEEVLSLRSVPSMRLFEILYALSYRGKRDTPITFEIDELKQRIGLDGKYERFKDFKYVLDRAQDEFAKFTSITFSYSGKKDGRAYRRVTFTVAPNSAYQPRIRLDGWAPERSGTHEEGAHKDAARALGELGWIGDAASTIRRYGSNRVLRVTQHVADLVKDEGANITNPAGLARSLLENDASVPDPTKQRSERLTSVERQRVVDAILAEFQAEQQAVASEAWEALSSETQDVVHARMRSTLNPFVLGRLETAGWQGSLYESNRLTAMKDLNAVDLPETLMTAHAFVVERGSLQALGPEDANAVKEQLLLEEFGENFEIESV